jgi:chromosome segregation ATPase
LYNPFSPLFKKIVNKCRELHKENMELYNYSQGGTLENLRHENSLEKGQIDQLMMKLKEKENIREDLEGEINEISDTIGIVSKRIKELEDRNAELEKEVKPSKPTKNKD